jgi:hypothetical protein
MLLLFILPRALYLRERSAIFEINGVTSEQLFPSTDNHVDINWIDFNNASTAPWTSLPR